MLTQLLQLRSVKWSITVSDELKNTWKETALAYFISLSQYFSDGSEENWEIFE
jgi:hypothetical protein